MKKQRNDNDDDDFDFSIPDIDIGADLLGDNAGFTDAENQRFADTFDDRYCRPEQHPRGRVCCFEHAQDFIKAFDGYRNNDRIDCFVPGDFIFGDFIEAFIYHFNIKCKRMIISTLSMKQDNIDSLNNLLQGGFVDQLDLIISSYFYHVEVNLMKYIYTTLDVDNRFQLAVCRIHTKTCQFETLGGKKIIIHGSANLRSSNCFEQFTLEENPTLYDFYLEVFEKILVYFQTIKKPIPYKEAWKIFKQR